MCPQEVIAAAMTKIAHVLGAIKTWIFAASRRSVSSLRLLLLAGTPLASSSACGDELVEADSDYCLLGTGRDCYEEGLGWQKCAADDGSDYSVWGLCEVNDDDGTSSTCSRERPPRVDPPKPRFARGLKPRE